MYGVQFWIDRGTHHKGGWFYSGTFSSLAQAMSKQLYEEYEQGIPTRIVTLEQAKEI